jgi:tetratricopeptide (TPR) repeat protein
MPHLFARLARLAVVFLIAVPLTAQEPWDAPPFSADPRAMLEAAAKVPAGTDGLVVLLYEMAYSFEADGSRRAVMHAVYRIDEQSAIEQFAQVAALWAPWHEDRPAIAARVITKDGTVHLLDARTVAEAPASESLEIFSDNRIVHAPLPAVAVGSIVEYTTTTPGRSPIEGAGTSAVFVSGLLIPIERVRLVIDGPASIEPRIVNRSGVEPRIEESGGRRRMTFTTSGRTKLERIESHVPFDQASYPYIAFSTGTSWQDIAARYAKIVDGQIAGSDLKARVEAAAGNAKKPRDIAARLLAAIQKEIRYAGVEIAEGSIIPRPPGTVLQNKYGDCKDKAALLVAMLRQAGLTAHVALLRAGSDLDTHAELPGFGRFNHAIVRLVDGKDEIWIDPTDEFARAGELPVVDQGRMALVAAPGTSRLTRTPELPSTANLYSETRIFNLAEHGKPAVIEVTEATGPNDADQRRDYATTATEKYRERMEGWVKSHYLAKALTSVSASDPHDLQAPFKTTLMAEESGNGMVRGGEAAVAFHPGIVAAGLPQALRNWKEPQPGDDPPKPRAADFLFPEPAVREYTYRIVPPAGYVARTLPDSGTRQLGTTTLTTGYSIDPGGVVIARLRLDSGKRRLTAREYEETRVAIGKLIAEPQVVIGFEMTGQAKLAAGDVAGALAEFRRLAALHPQEAQHHLELANALLAGGLGEAAREEARRAVAIEPGNARAHLVLGLVLQHDLLGRRYHKGSDLAAARESLRKASELGRENLEIRVELAQVLTYSPDGVQFGTGTRLAEAEAEYREIVKDFGDDASAQKGVLMLILAHAGKFDELKELAATVEGDQSRHVGRLIAITASEGTDAALRELGKLDLETRRKVAQELVLHLMNLRYYGEAASMLALATQNTPNAADSAVVIETLRKTKRFETAAPREDDPATVLVRIGAALLTGDSEALRRLVAPGMAAAVKSDEDAGRNTPFDFVRALVEDASVRPEIAIDVHAAQVQVGKDGSDETGYRLRHRLPGRELPVVAYVSREEGRYVLRALDHHHSLGLAALHFLDRGEVDRARIWLNWAREAEYAGDGDDALSRSAFAMVWPKAKQTATADEVRLAAVLQISQTSAASVDLALELREKAASDATKLAIDAALADAYGLAERWEDNLPVARRLFEAHPDSVTAFLSLGTTLAKSGRHDEAAALAKKRLEQFPRDTEALRLLAQNASEARDYPAADKYAQQLLDETSARRNDYNNAAWYVLLTGNLERAITLALQATDEEVKDSSALHTLASIYAEADKPLQARQALLSSMENAGRLEPRTYDWYVLGRIAETYGVREAALAAYERVPKEKEEKDFEADVADLVARRVAKLK